MSDCIWKGSDHPRAIKHRHLDHCADGECRGCEPCRAPHCVVCGIEHVSEQTCPECVGASRDDLFEIVKLWRDLPNQALHGGSNGLLEAGREIPGGEALVMIAPGSDGRAVIWAKERGDDVSHRDDERKGELAVPEIMLVGWEDDWRSLLGSRTDDPASLPAAVTYLDDHLSWAAQHHDAFDSFATEVRQQRAHLEDVLHAGERQETGAPCFKCGKALVLIYGDDDGDESTDRWCCEGKRCDAKPLTREEYARNATQESMPYAEWLSSTDMELQWGIPSGSTRGWGSDKADPRIRKRRDFHTGRMVYNVEDARRRAGHDLGDRVGDIRREVS